jgi:hypothetical protein
MNRMPIGIVPIGFACLLGAAGCASEQAARQPTSAGSSASPATTKAASVGPSDSLKACLTRISSDSSDGARMVAEQICHDNEKLHQSVVGAAIAHPPGRRVIRLMAARRVSPQTPRQVNECWRKKAVSVIS